MSDIPPAHFTGAPAQPQPSFTTTPSGGSGRGPKIALAIGGVLLFLILLVVGVLLVLSRGGGDSEITDAARQQIADTDDPALLLDYETYGSVDKSQIKLGPLGEGTVKQQDGSNATVVVPGSLTRPLNIPPYYDQDGGAPNVEMKVDFNAEMSEYPKGWFAEKVALKERATTPKSRAELTEADRQAAADVARRALLAATNVGGSISTAAYDGKQPDAYLTGPGRKGLNATTDERARFSRVLPPTSGPKGGVRDTAETLLVARNDLSCFSKGVKQVRTTTGAPRFDARVKGDRPASGDLQVVWVSFPTQLSATYTCSDYPKNTTKKLRFTPRFAVALVRPSVALPGSDEWRVAAMKIDDPKAYAQPLYEPFDLSLPFRPEAG